MDFIGLLATQPTGLWHTIIYWFSSFINSYGWAIILFTVCLKLVLSPLDFFQKAAMRKTQRQQAMLKPELDKIKEKYGNNKEIINQKTMELYRKNNVSPAGGCLPMLISLVVTMVVFFTLFSAMNQISQFKIQDEYEKLSATYQASYEANYAANKDYYDTNFVGGSDIKFAVGDSEYTYDEIVEKSITFYNENQQDGKIDDVEYADANAYADAVIEDTRVQLALKSIQDDVLNEYNEIKESWLWVKNIYRPDNYSSSFPKYAEFISMTGGKMYAEKTEEGTENKYYYKSIDKTAPNSTNGYYYLTGDADLDKVVLENAQNQGYIDFNNITKSVQSEYSSWNGYFILILMAGFATVLGQLLATAGAKAKLKSGEEIKVGQNTNKIMLFVMPAIMIWFTWSYSALFALYIVVNSLMSVLIGYVINLIINKTDAKQQAKEIQRISMPKEQTQKPSKTVVSSSIAKEDYKIEKKGRIIEEKPEKKNKGEK